MRWLLCFLPQGAAVQALDRSFRPFRSFYPTYVFSFLLILPSVHFISLCIHFLGILVASLYLSGLGYTTHACICIDVDLDSEE